jgi:hypothetical protein
MAFPRAHWTKIRTTNLLETLIASLNSVARWWEHSLTTHRCYSPEPCFKKEEWKIRYELIDLEENLINETGPIMQITAKY